MLVLVELRQKINRSDPFKLIGRKSELKANDDFECGADGIEKQAEMR